MIPWHFTCIYRPIYWRFYVQYQSHHFISIGLKSVFFHSSTNLCSLFIFLLSHNRNNIVIVPKICVENFFTNKRHGDDEKRFKSLSGIFIQPLYGLMDSNRFLHFLQCKGFYGLFCVCCCCWWFFSMCEWR